MEASKLSCIGSPRHALCAPSRGIRRGKAAQVVASSISTQLPLIPSGRSSSHSQQLCLLPVVGALSNLVQRLPVWAAEEASSSADGGSAQVSESAGAALEPVLSSVESAGVAASLAVQSSVESVGDAASQVVQSSVERVGRAASQTAGSNGGMSIENGDMVINILGTTAFIGLSLLTLAVVYLFITDFLEKRKRDEELKKLNEEEAALRKKKGSSLTAASKGGVKGFGRKRPVDDDVSAS